MNSSSYHAFGGTGSPERVDIALNSTPPKIKID
jgi:hypothetical protein